MSERTAALDRQFTDFVESNQGALSRLAVMLTGNRAAADDLLQDALLKSYLAWERIQPGLAMAYTRRVMANLATDRWRRRRFEVLPGEVAINAAHPAAEAALTVVEDRDRILRELARLTPHERAMVVLHYYADLSEKQVAEELGVSVGTVKSTCSRALARLRPGAGPRAIPTGA